MRALTALLLLVAIAGCIEPEPPVNETGSKVVGVYAADGATFVADITIAEDGKMLVNSLGGDSLQAIALQGALAEIRSKETLPLRSEYIDEKGNMVMIATDIPPTNPNYAYALADELLYHGFDAEVK